MAEQTAGVSRRRVIQGAAWATPAIVLATAAPALAQSPASTATISAVLGTHDNKVKHYTLTIAAGAVDLVGGFSVLVSSTDGVSSVVISGAANGFTVSNHTLLRASGVSATDSVQVTVIVTLSSADPHNTSVRFTLMDDAGTAVATA